MDKSVRALVLETDLDTASPNGLESLCPAWSPKPPLVKSQRAAQIFGSRAGLWVQPQHRAENQTGAPDCRAPVTPLPGAGSAAGFRCWKQLSLFLPLQTHPKSEPSPICCQRGEPRADLAGFPPPLAALSVYSIYLWPGCCWCCQGNPSTPPSPRRSVCAPTAGSEPAEGIDPPAPGLQGRLSWCIPKLTGAGGVPGGGWHLPMAPQGSVRDPKCSSAAPVSESLKKWGDPGGWLRQELLNVLG